MVDSPGFSLAAETAVVGFVVDAIVVEAGFLVVLGLDRFRVCIMVLKSLSSFMRSLCLYMFSASILTKFAMPESFPVYFCIRA